MAVVFCSLIAASVKFQGSSSAVQSNTLLNTITLTRPFHCPNEPFCNWNEFINTFVIVQIDSFQLLSSFFKYNGSYVIWIDVIWAVMKWIYQHFRDGANRFNSISRIILNMIQQGGCVRLAHNCTGVKINLMTLSRLKRTWTMPNARKFHSKNNNRRVSFDRTFTCE